MHIATVVASAQARGPMGGLEEAQERGNEEMEEVGEEVGGDPEGSVSGSHRLTHIIKRHSCMVCRLDFRRGMRWERQRPKLARVECLGCSPPVALCKPEDSPCFSRWHDNRPNESLSMPLISLVQLIK